MKPYTLFVYVEQTLPWTSVDMIGNGLVRGFHMLPHVTVRTEVCHADIVVVVAYYATRPDFATVKLLTRAKKVVSVRGVNMDYDYSFLFRDELRLPCRKDLMVNVQKTPNTILIDHSWDAYLNTELGWTSRIEHE